MDAKSRETLRNASLAAAQDGYARWSRRVTGELPAEPRPPVTRKPRGKSAATLVEELAGRLTEQVERVRETTEAEVRYYLGQALAELAADTADRVAEVQYDGARDEVTDAYRAGLLHAARLVADPTFEY